MAIPRITFFNFLFNNGRGIRADQVDWSVSDADLTALLSSLGAAGNTAYALTTAPDDVDGADGDIAIALLSPTELAGYSKVGGTWTQVWTFSGGGGGGVDQTARDAAATAQGEIDTHEASTHNTDPTARAAVANVMTEIDTHEASTHNTDPTARTAAAAAQTDADAAQAEIDSHEASPHNEDATARANATAAQDAADNAQTEGLSHAALPHNTDQVARAGVDTAQQAANAAGAAAMDANAAAVTAGQTATDAETDAAAADQRIISHIAAHPGSTISAVFSPNADGSFPAVTEDMYEDGAVLVSPNALRVPFRYPSGGTTRNMATWNTYTAENFYVVLQYSNFPADAPDGARGYTTYNHGFWMKEGGHWLTNAPPPGLTYLGDFPSNGAANDAVTGNNQLAYFSRILHVSANYVAGGDVIYSYGWTVDAPVPHRLIEAEATDSDSEVFGEVSGKILSALATPTTGGSGFARTSLTARNTTAASLARTVRHLTLSTALADIDDDDDIEIIMESTGLYRAINPQIRFRAKLLKDRVVSTFAAGTSFSSSYSFVAEDALKYLEFKVTRGNADDSNDFAHDNILVGRIGAGTTADPEKIVIWSATASAWGHYWVNRVQYGAAQTGGQQLGDGSVGGYYFGAFYQQAAAEPAFDGLPDNDGAWSSLGDWQASRGDAVDAASTDPVWVAYASGYIDDNDVIFVSSPQVFAEFSTQYSNDGFVTITGAEPTDPDGWWRRDRLPGGGVTAPIPLFHTDNPWIPVWAEEDFYTTSDDGASKDIDLNLANVTAIRFTLTAFGLWSVDGNGIPERPGAVCTDVMPRPPVGWSTTDFNDNGRATTGIYSVYYHESAGLQVHHQNDGSVADFNIPTGSYRSVNYPARAWACALKFIAPDTNDHLLVTALRIFDSPQHYERFLWTIEVQREN